MLIGKNTTKWKNKVPTFYPSTNHRGNFRRENLLRILDIYFYRKTISEQNLIMKVNVQHCSARIPAQVLQFSC